MISVIVYGRNDSYGYNLPKRAAISFNCIAEVLTHPNDEIVYVDCNTPDDMPTFAEAIEDTLTPRTRQILRILRLRPASYERGKNGAKFKVLEPLCRNVAIRRTNPANRWVLNTNTDMVFTPVDTKKSLSEVVANLPDGFYELPRFEVPEILWETMDRMDPKTIINSFRHWGRRLHINEVVTNLPEILFDGPGDFQLALRSQMFAISGMDERMVLGWHVDSNLCKRMFLLNGKTSHLLDRCHAYHCDHTRINTPYHSAGESTSNDYRTFFDNVTSPYLPEQAQTWGMPNEPVEEIRLTEDHDKRYVKVLETLIEANPAPTHQSSLIGASFNHGLLYNNQHILPYVADHITMIPPTVDVGYFGANLELLRLLADFRKGFGHSGVIMYDAELMVCGGIKQIEKLPDNCLPAKTEQILQQCYMYCLDAWMGNFPTKTNPSNITIPQPGLEAGNFGIELLNRCLEIASREKKRSHVPGDFLRKTLFLGTQHTWIENITTLLFGVVLTPYSSYVRHGFVRKDAFEKPFEYLHGNMILLDDNLSADRIKLATQILTHPVPETDLPLAELRARRIADDLNRSSFDIENAMAEDNITASDCALLQVEIMLNKLSARFETAQRLEKVMANWGTRIGKITKQYPSPSEPAPSRSNRSRVTVGIDARTFFYTDSTSRGIGQYTINHLKHSIPLKPDWQFLLLVEEKRSIPALDRLASLPNVQLRYISEITTDDLDMLHVPDPLNLSVGFDSPMRLYPGIPSTTVFYDLTTLRFYWNLWSDKMRQGYLNRLAQLKERQTHLLAISEYTRKDLLKSTDIAPDHITVIMAGLNRAEKQEPITPGFIKEVKKKYGITKPFFLHVGALDPHKNFETVIQSIGKMRSKDGVQLVVVGEKEHFLKEIAEHCARQKMKDIIFPGFIPRQDLEALYHDAVALLFLSKYEGFGLPVLEAMAQGCPVITTNVTSIPEVAGDAALLFDPTDAAAISQGMQKLMSDNQLRETLRSKGMEQSKKFPWSMPAQKTVDIWEQIMASRPTSRATKETGPDRTTSCEEKAIDTPPAAAQSPSSVQKPIPAAQNKPSTFITHPVAWLAPWQNPSGYCTEALALAKGVADQINLELADVAKTRSQSFVSGLPESTRNMLFSRLREKVDVTGKIAIQHMPGSGFSPTFGSVYDIGRTMFETDRIPASWVSRCNLLDEIWVPTQFNFETFASSGVERDKLVIIPGAVDESVFNPDIHSPLNLPDPARFNFLSVFEWSGRKAWDILLSAYFHEFSAEDDVCLYLRTYLVNQPDADPRAALSPLINKLVEILGLKNKPLPRIQFLAEQVPSAQLPRLYKSVDCLVMPSRGEGWGRPHHESMMMGTPVIATNWSGTTGFMTEKNSYLLDFELEEARNLEQGLNHYAGHRWAKPSEKHLRQLMRHVYQNAAEAKAKGQQARKDMLEGFSIEPVARIVLKRLQEIEARLTTPACPAVTARVLSAQKQPVSTLPKIALEGSFLDLGSLSHVNREFAGALSQISKDSVTLVGNPKLSGAAATVPELKSLASQIVQQRPAGTQITIRHEWPPRWTTPESGAWIHIQPWEYGALPADWIQSVSKADEIWTYSNYVRRVYVDSGVEPSKVKVVPLGINPDVFHPGAAPMALPTQKKFKFLFVGGTIHRKGPDVLLKTYLEQFTASDDVCLIIKDFGSQGIYAGQTLDAQIKEALAKPNAPEIIHLNRELPIKDLPGLYTACNCLVHPYRGEGFGLPVLEAMACGLPVIVTGGGSTDDFADDAHAYRIPALKLHFGNSVSGMALSRAGWMLEPDLAALKERMQWVCNHQEDAREMGMKASQHARTQWTWGQSARIASELLCDMAQRLSKCQVPGHKADKAFKLPAVAVIGHLGEARTLFGRKNNRDAWEKTIAAIHARPYHPEAYLLLAEISLAAGNGNIARQCAQKARDMAPGWKPARQFLKGNLKGSLHPEWMTLPEALSDSKSPAAPRLSVCMIVKNEQDHLEKCLSSIRKVASQIVIVDTGSADNTVEIAKKFSAEIFSHTWDDDFSNARNAALEHATGDWILALDADEVLTEESQEELVKQMNNPTTMAWRLPIVDAGREEDGCSYVPRLFRNAPALFYVGRVHEQVFSSIEVRRTEWGLENRLGTATLLHYGYTDEMTRSRDKVMRNLRLLEMAIEELPDEPSLVMNHGLELVRSGQKEAGLEQYLKAYNILAHKPASEVVPELKETLLTQLCSHLKGAKRFHEIIQILNSPLAKNGGLTATLHFNLGLAHMQLGQHAEAAEQMKQCLAKRNQPALSPINKEIRKAGPHHCLAIALSQMKQLEAANEAFTKAIEEDPASRPVRLDYARFLAANNHPVEALQLIHGLTTENPDDISAWLSGGELTLSRPELLEVACDWTQEASLRFPADANVMAQRAQTLLLSGNCQDALPLWRQLSQSPTHGHWAALVLCEVVVNQQQFIPPAQVEPMVSRAFIQWYQRLVQFEQSAVVLQVNDSISLLKKALPSAAQIVEQVIKEAGQPETKDL